MSTDTVQLFLALLAVIAAAITVYVVVIWVARRRSALDQVSSVALVIGWLVATTSTLGSLYLSEIAGYTPCRLCWWQRFAMYPLILVLGYAILRRSRIASWLALAATTVGAGLAAYHTLLQRFPDLDAGTCSISHPCTSIYIEELGIFTIPTMALVGFITIGVLLSLRLTRDREVVA